MISNNQFDILNSNGQPSFRLGVAGGYDNPLQSWFLSMSIGRLPSVSADGIPQRGETFAFFRLWPSSMHRLSSAEFMFLMEVLNIDISDDQKDALASDNVPDFFNFSLHRGIDCIYQIAKGVTDLYNSPLGKRMIKARVIELQFNRLMNLVENN